MVLSRQHQRQVSSPTSQPRHRRQARARKALEEIEAREASAFEHLPGETIQPFRLARNFDLDLESDAMDASHSKYCWQYFFLKGCALLYVFGIMWLCSPLVSWVIYGYPHVDTAGLSAYQHDPNYFTSFTGHDECGLTFNQTYDPPQANGGLRDVKLCNSRPTVLKAMSDGGRIGFDAPYYSKDCQHRWFTPKEVCTILQRFENVVFVGDASLLPIYAGLNILLTKDLSTGALNTTAMTEKEIDHCHCQNQFARRDCRVHWLGADKDDIEINAQAHHKFYPTCSRSAGGLHYIPYGSSPLSPSMAVELRSLIPSKKKAYKPIPIIHSLTYATLPPLSITAARHSLTELLNLADSTGRKTPILIIGPLAPAPDEFHVPPPDKFPLHQFNTEGDEITDKSKHIRPTASEFSAVMEQTAAELDVEWLGMWNATALTSHFGYLGNGPALGEHVAITQAMMVLNWLARLRSS